MELIINTKQVAEKGSYQCWLNITDFMEALLFQIGIGFWQVERKKTSQTGT